VLIVNPNATNRPHDPPPHEAVTIVFYRYNRYGPLRPFLTVTTVTTPAVNDHFFAAGRLRKLPVRRWSR